MADAQKSNNNLDAGAASMAYMPGVDGKSEAAADAEMKIDVKAEKQTMADIAAELEAEDKSSVKVPIGGAAAQNEPKPAASTKAKSTTPKAAPLVVKDSTIPAADAQSELEEADLPESNTPKRRKSKLGPVMALVAILAIAGAGYMWWNNRSIVSDLKAKLTGLESSESTLKKELEDAQADSSSTQSNEPVVAATGTRLIPEVALTYKLTDATKKVTYSYTEVTDSANVVHSVLRFNTTEVIAAERKVVSDPTKYTCTTDSAPLGLLTSYKAGDTVSGGKASALKIDGKTNFKIGETYFVFTPAQSTCSSDKTVQAALTAGQAPVAELLASLAR